MRSSRFFRYFVIATIIILSACGPWNTTETELFFPLDLKTIEEINASSTEAKKDDADIKTLKARLMPSNWVSEEILGITIEIKIIEGEPEDGEDEESINPEISYSVKVGSNAPADIKSRQKNKTGKIDSKKVQFRKSNENDSIFLTDGTGTNDNITLEIANPKENFQEMLIHTGDISMKITRAN